MNTHNVQVGSGLQPNKKGEIRGYKMSQNYEEYKNR